MDIANTERKRKKKVVTRSAVVGAVIVVTAVVIGTIRYGAVAPSVPRDNLWTDAVTRGDLIQEIRAPGKLVPRDFRWLAASAPAQVQKIEILPGAQVHPDTVILRLSSPETEESLRNAQSQVALAEAQLAAKRTELQSQLLDHKSTLAQAVADHAAADVRFKADESAWAKRIVPEVQYKQSQIAVTQFAYRVEVEKQRLASFLSNMQAQLASAKATLDAQRSNLALREHQFDGLLVRAGLEGVLQEVPVQEGQQVASGVNLARVARPDVLMANLQVPEIQAKDITTGMDVQIDTYNGVAKGHVSRIDPAVIAGSVRVDVTLVGALPPGARPDLAIDGRVTVAVLHDVLSLPRPARAVAQSDNSLFVLRQDEAIRNMVRLGVLSVDRAQVLDGAKVGDRVILSDVSQWSDYNRLRLE